MISIPRWIGIGWAQKLQQGASKPPEECITVLCMNFGQVGHQTLPPKKRFWRTWSFNFDWKVVCPCPGSMEHDSKTCSLACGWAYGCTIALVAAIIIVKAKQDSNPFVLDTVETTPTATSFCAISIHVFLPRLCGPASVWGVVASLSYNNFLLTVCVRKTECGHVWQPGFLYSTLGPLASPSCTKHISATDSSHRSEHDRLEEHLLTWLVLSASLRCSGISLEQEVLM